jgi:hypothetical protein
MIVCHVYDADADDDAHADVVQIRCLNYDPRFVVNEGSCVPVFVIVSLISQTNRFRTAGGELFDDVSSREAYCSSMKYIKYQVKLSFGLEKYKIFWLYFR